MSPEKEVALFNASQSTFRTSKGPFKPGSGPLPLPADEANRLLRMYPGVRKAGEYTPPKGRVQELEKKVAELEKQLKEGAGDQSRVQELEAQVAELEKRLEKKSGAKELKAADARIAELEKQLEALQQA